MMSCGGKEANRCRDNRNCSCSSNRPYCTCAGGGDLKELLSEGVHSSAPPAGPRTYRGPALSLLELPRSHTGGSSVNRGTPLEGHAASRKSAIIPHHAIPLAGCDDCYGSHPNRTRRVPTNGAVAWLTCASNTLESLLPLAREEVAPRASVGE